ncbi:hypothetical protein D477_003303 [Arthrobacter crystallopoietes BAB-32]|uniref:Cytoplasmic protein n=1 Tax=Arthrobacter crystallopoietes BAB-32 TaxID=1246476 RepID=N1V6F5_9MICC|nr:hypothetical protein D477_003303 [Arthrobacter crystallopoietes BAB-32]
MGRTFDRLQLLQIDSVNVLARAHYLPMFSRLGNYDVGILHRFSGSAPRRMVEYWAHEASYIRPDLFADLKVWQKRRWIGDHGLDPLLRQDLEKRILEELAAARPLTARQIADRIGHREAKSTVNWGWNWNAVKRVLEALFERGAVSAAGRNAQFERLYALTAKVMPKTAGRQPAVDKDESMVRLMDAAARAHGIGTVRCFADYFRVPRRPAEEAVRRLVSDGRLEEVSVEGWQGTHYLHTAAARPRRAAGQALLGPFDSLVFERERLERLFGFRYRIEIYTPAHQRQYGYYVLPFLLHEQLCARVDLKAHRAAGFLEVRGAFREPEAPEDTAVALASELVLMAQWLELSEVQVADRGDLAPELSRALAQRARPAPAPGTKAPAGT